MTGRLLLASVCLFASTTHGIEYTVTKLGANFAPIVINDHGDIVGQGLVDGFGGVVGFFDGQFVPLVSRASVFAMNNHRQIVGLFTVNNIPHGFFFDQANSDWRVLDAFGGQCSYMHGINDSGQVSGTVRDSQDYARAVIYTTGTGYTKDVGGYNTEGSRINAAGHVTGKSYTWDSVNQIWKTRGFIYNGTSKLTLGTLGGNTDNPYDINDFDQIAGSCKLPNGEIRAVIWGQDRTAQSLGTLGGTFSSSRAINNDGVAVGVSRDGSGRERAFMYSDNQMIDLNTIVGNSDWEFLEAVDINNSGQIVGRGKLNGLDQNWLLTPVPEPSTVILLFCILSPVLMRRANCERTRP